MRYRANSFQSDVDKAKCEFFLLRAFACSSAPVVVSWDVIQYHALLLPDAAARISTIWGSELIRLRCSRDPPKLHHV